MVKSMTGHRLRGAALAAEARIAGRLADGRGKPRGVLFLPLPFPVFELAGCDAGFAGRGVAVAAGLMLEALQWLGFAALRAGFHGVSRRSTWAKSSGSVPVF